MKITTTETFCAEATFGSKRGYSNKIITLKDFKRELAEAQNKIASELQIKLSGKVTPCTIIFSGQDEDSFSLSFIQYPKFPHDLDLLKKGITLLVEILMETLDQNRVVLVFDDQTLMLEIDEDLLDPGIDFES